MLKRRWKRGRKGRTEEEKKTERKGQKGEREGSFKTKIERGTITQKNKENWGKGKERNKKK